MAEETVAPRPQPRTWGAFDATRCTAWLTLSTPSVRSSTADCARVHSAASASVSTSCCGRYACVVDVIASCGVVPRAAQRDRMHARDTAAQCSAHLQAVVGPSGDFCAQDGHHALHVCLAHQPRLAPSQDAHHHLEMIGLCTLMQHVEAGALFPALWESFLICACINALR